jgi:hypothetical protein
MNRDLADIEFIPTNPDTSLVLDSGAHSENEERAVVYCLSQINELLTRDYASFTERLRDWSDKDKEQLCEEMKAINEGLAKAIAARNQEQNHG